MLVEENKEILELLAEQVLIPMGFDVIGSSDAGDALRQAMTLQPDLIIASLTLPGLSGKDLLVALRSQGIQAPVLVMAESGLEAEALQAFRLGARDFLAKPLREAEVLAAVERALAEVRLRQERQSLAAQLAETNKQLEARVRELATLYAIGKAVASTSSQRELFTKIIEGSIYLTRSDVGWILLQDETSRRLVLRVQRNLPAEYAEREDQPWDDGMSSLVMLSGDVLRLNGDGLKRFTLSKFSQAVLLTPIRVRNLPIGVICVARQRRDGYSQRDQDLMEAVADYASISMVNTRLFQALQSRAQQLELVIQQGRSSDKKEIERSSAHSLMLESIRYQLGELITSARDPDTHSTLQSILQEIEILSFSLPPSSERKEDHYAPTSLGSFSS